MLASFLLRAEGPSLGAQHCWPRKCESISCSCICFTKVRLMAGRCKKHTPYLPASRLKQCWQLPGLAAHHHLVHNVLALVMQLQHVVSHACQYEGHTQAATGVHLKLLAVRFTPRCSALNGATR